MLPGLGFTEMLALAVIALLVVGPRDLPLMLRKLGRFTARLRGMANEFRMGLDELARQAELDELKREVEALRKGQVIADIEAEARKPLMPPTRTTFAAPDPPQPEPAPPERPDPTPSPEPPQQAPPAPPEIPPISPPPPSGPEPITAGGRM